MNEHWDLLAATGKAGVTIFDFESREAECKYVLVKSDHAGLKAHLRPPKTAAAPPYGLNTKVWSLGTKPCHAIPS